MMLLMLLDVADVAVFLVLECWNGGLVLLHLVSIPRG